MSLTSSFWSVAVLFISISSSAAVPAAFDHPEYGKVNRVMGAFVDQRNQDAFFLASVPTSTSCMGDPGYGEPTLDYAWFWMDGKSRALKPLTEVWCDEGRAFWQFAQKLKAHNKSNRIKPNAASDECYSSERKWCAGGDFETPATDGALSAPWPWVVLPATLAVTLPVDVVYNAGAYGLAGIDYLIQSKFRFKHYYVALHADDWAVDLIRDFQTGDSVKRLKHKHFRYLLGSFGI